MTFTNLFSFSGTNGIEPEGKLLQTSDANFYGTARETSLQQHGNGNFGVNGHGVIFKVTTNGGFSVLAFFTNCYDNATMESFWATLKLELVYRHSFSTRTQAKTQIFDYIEIFYNRQRAHSALDFHSPVDFELLNH